ncbi:MAG TPA: glycosyltransferase family 39 protein [Candidatus Polarisedimenticolaceae bacterium]|nr:glycosyltransferase family 39 protein [Candidatus Polarisedimenticolaceae bacterium]
MPTRLAVALLLAALFLQGILGSRQLSAAFDEATHLASGYSYLKTGDYRLNPQHPPLGKLLCALPLLALGPQLDLADPGWRESEEWGFGHRFLYGNDADRLLFWGRLPVILLSLLLAAYVWRWAGELFGAAAGLGALVLCVLCPTVVAHSRFVTFDVPLAAFSTMALYHGWRCTRRESWAQRLLAGTGLGLAMATKFSGLVLLATVPVLVLLSGFEHKHVRRAALDLLVVLLVAAAIVTVVYAPSGGLRAYVDGARLVNRDHDPSFVYYLNGEFRPGGFWNYFLIAFLVKTPLPTLLALAGSIVLWRRLRAPQRRDEAFLVLPALAWIVATSAGADDLGVRYLLPAYPLVFVFASRLAPWLLARRAGRLAAALLALWLGGTALWIFPDQLAYFNEAAGGPARGHRWLDDSNLDWGQDVKRLASWLREQKIERVKLRLPPNANPEYYGIHGEPLPDAEWSGPPAPGVYALSAHVLIRGEQYARERGLATDWLHRYRPAARIGYSIYVFRF